MLDTCIDMKFCKKIEPLNHIVLLLLMTTLIWKEYLSLNACLTMKIQSVHGKDKIDIDARGFYIWIFIGLAVSKIFIFICGMIAFSSK